MGGNREASQSSVGKIQTKDNGAWIRGAAVEMVKG